MPDTPPLSADTEIEDSRFFDNALSELNSMEEAYAYAMEFPPEGEAAVKNISNQVFILKHQAETLGYTLLTQASDSLYDFCSLYFRPGDSAQFIVIRKHLDTIKFIVREKMRGDGGAKGHELIQSLHLLRKKYK